MLVPRLAPPEWFERYSRRIEDARLPTKPEERQQYAEVIGTDGLRLLEAVYASEAPIGCCRAGLESLASR